MQKNRVLEYVQKSSKKYTKELYLFNNIFVYIKDVVPDHIDVSSVLQKIEQKLPYELMQNVDSIFVGQFEEFYDNDTNAFYKDSAIFVTNEQDDVDDMVDDIVHEVAHSLQEVFSLDLFSDDKVENEFIGKRTRLKHILDSEGLLGDMTLGDFLNPKHSVKFDSYLYREVGYPKLVSLTMGLFNSPYAATSLREYYANGFEEYYLRDREYISKVSPSLTQKIEKLELLTREG